MGLLLRECLGQNGSINVMRIPYNHTENEANLNYSSSSTLLGLLTFEFCMVSVLKYFFFQVSNTIYITSLYLLYINLYLLSALYFLNIFLFNNSRCQKGIDLKYCIIKSISINHRTII